MLLQNGRLIVRKLEVKDKLLLVKWLSNPVVLEFYEGRDNPFSIEQVEQAFYPTEDDEMRCIVEFDGKAIGYIQYYLLDDKTQMEYGYFAEPIFGMDQFIGEVAYWNKGIGQLLVSSIVDFLIDEMKAKLVVMDPRLSNIRAIKCYEKCGFKKIKILPKHELHEGEYHDCWLMEYHP